jgi:hypothetical protein
MGRKACATCPWRKSAPPGGFPGGCVNEPELRRMASGEPYMKVMQCHCTPDGTGKVCVGFAIRVGPQSVGYRLAGMRGLIDDVEDDGDLLESIEEVIDKHNTSRGFVCK